MLDIMRGREGKEDGLIGREIEPVIWHVRQVLQD